MANGITDARKTRLFRFYVANIRRYPRFSHFCTVRSQILRKGQLGQRLKKKTDEFLQKDCAKSLWTSGRPNLRRRFKEDSRNWEEILEENLKSCLKNSEDRHFRDATQASGYVKRSSWRSESHGASNLHRSRHLTDTKRTVLLRTQSAGAHKRRIISNVCARIHCTSYV